MPSFVAKLPLWPRVTSLLSLLLCVFSSSLTAAAQTGPLIHPPRATHPEKTSDIYFAVPPNAKVTLNDGKAAEADFGSVPLGLVGMAPIPVTEEGGNPIVSIGISGDTDLSAVFKVVDAGCAIGRPPDPDNFKKTTCTVVVGFMPADKSSVKGTLTITFWKGPPQSITLTGEGATAVPCRGPNAIFLPLKKGFEPGNLYPFLPPDVKAEQAGQIYSLFGDPIRRLVVNCYYSSSGLVSYFNQFQSIYNAASGAATLNANIVSLNFIDGNNLTVGANPQIASSNTTTTSTTLTAGVPTLSASQTAQAAQNMLNGGTVFADDVYPLIYNPVGPVLNILNFEAKEGVDLQKFNNTSITSTNPSTHTFVGLEGYLQINSSNNAANSSNPAGTIFLSGKYGWSLANHTYSVQNGFGGRVNYQTGQLGAGILISGVARIAAYRGFGPTQVYIDSTSKVQTKVNNFKTWSFAIAYQSSAKSK